MYNLHAHDYLRGPVDMYNLTNGSTVRIMITCCENWRARNNHNFFPQFYTCFTISALYVINYRNIYIEIFVFDWDWTHHDVLYFVLKNQKFIGIQIHSLIMPQCCYQCRIVPRRVHSFLCEHTNSLNLCHFWTSKRFQERLKKDKFYVTVKTFRLKLLLREIDPWSNCHQSFLILYSGKSWPRAWILPIALIESSNHWYHRRFKK